MAKKIKLDKEYFQEAYNDLIIEISTIEQEMSTFFAELDKIKSAWEGTSGDAFDNAKDCFKANYIERYRGLSNLAEVSRSAADILTQTDESLGS